MSEADDVRMMREALAALATTATQMASLGVERTTESQALWSERLAVKGTGMVTLSTNRSFGDASGAAIGHFETSLSADRVAELASAAAAVLQGGPPPHLSPSDVQIALSVVAAGARWERQVGGLPPDLAPYQPLLRALNEIARSALASPVATLSLRVTFGAHPRAGIQRLPVTLEFENGGSSGYWLRNPSAGMEDTEDEHVRLWYAQRQPEVPGVTALPLEPFAVALEPSVRAERPLMWIGPQAVEGRSFTASLEVDPGSYLFRASFATYSGGETIGGQPLMRGCVFSQEISVEVAR
jgi:hypothetical protein